MKLHDLQNQLRAHIRARIGRGELTGSGLALRAGFPQGHLSNFLNFRRGLSLESMDRLLDTLEISVLDLVTVEDLQQRTAIPGSEDAVERVAMVSADNATAARLAPDQILETRSFNKSFLRKLKSRGVEDRGDWLRFVLVQLKMKAARGMFPRGVSSAVVLIDRHYSSLHPYRGFRPNLYVVRLDEGCGMGYASVCDNCLVMTPLDPDREIELLRIGRGRSYSEYIIGRVCHVGLEL